MKNLSKAFVFIEYDNRLFAHLSHFAHNQNPLSSGLRKATDCGAKSWPDGGVVLCESSVQVASNVSRILAREKHNDDSTTLERKLRLTRNRRPIFLTLARFKQAVM